MHSSVCYHTEDLFKATSSACGSWVTTALVTPIDAVVIFVRTSIHARYPRAWLSPGEREILVELEQSELGPLHFLDQGDNLRRAVAGLRWVESAIPN
jgi:hypothetical protein